MMRKNNKCSVNIVGGEVYACCLNFIGDDCTYGATDNKTHTCCWYGYANFESADLAGTKDVGICKNKEATNNAATRMVKKLRQKYGTDD